MDRIIRPCGPSDAAAIRRLLLRNERVYLNLEWRRMEDHLGQPGCLAMIAGNQVIGSLVCTREAAPGGWVRLAALADGRPGQPLFEALWDRMLPSLDEQGVTELGLLNPPSWLTAMASGFQPLVPVVTYAWYDAPIPDPIHRRVAIRPAQLADLPDLVDLDARAFDPIWRHNLSTLRLVLRQVTAFQVAVLDGRTVGFQFSSLFNGRGHLVRLTVDPAVQGTGIGGRLLASALELFRRRGVRVVTLNTQENNLRSRRLYERFGFRLTGDEVMTWRWTRDGRE